MNYYAPRQLKDGHWQYTNKDGNDYIYPLGYCGEWNEWEYFWIEITGTTIEDYRLHDKFKFKHHDGGHDNPDDACNCYREYLLDHAPLYSKRQGKRAQRCMSCQDKRTINYVIVSGDDYYLCDDCWNRDGLDKCFPAIGESWSSW